MKNQVKKTLNNAEDCSKKSSYKCDKCRDLTFVMEGNALIPCECRAIREAYDILKKSGISEQFRKMGFDNFNYARGTQTIEAFRKAKEYVDSFEALSCERSNSIIFMGQVGSGKTHLSMAIANDLMDSGVGVIYMSFRDVIMKIKQNIVDEAYYHREMGRYKNARVLLIDDLFKGSVTKSDLNIMFEIINHRYFNSLPIIVSTEKGFDELLLIDEAIGSRILEMCKGHVVEMKGAKLNYRIY